MAPVEGVKGPSFHTEDVTRTLHFSILLNVSALSALFTPNIKGLVEKYVIWNTPKISHKTEKQIWRTNDTTQLRRNWTNNL